MRSAIALAGLLLACNNPGPSCAPNRWSDAQLLLVLDAQEQRDTEKLCALLADTAVVVREAAALAFASVHNIASIPCLLKALSDPSPNVRSTAVFALGFVADSTTVHHLADHAIEETDSTVQRAYLSASFLAMQRNGMLTDPAAIIYFLQSSKGQDRVRAADALRRLPDSTISKIGAELIQLFAEEGPEVRPYLILAMKKLGQGADRKMLRDRAATGSDMERINALRVLAALEPLASNDLLTTQASDPVTGQLALELLGAAETLDGKALQQRALEVTDTATRIVLLTLAMKHGDEGVVTSAWSELGAMAKGITDPYLNALWIPALANSQEADANETLMEMLRSKEHPAERQAAFQGALRVVRNNMMRSRYASPEAQYAQLGDLLRTALNTGDAGLISAAAEELANESSDALRIMLDDGTVTKARSALLPIRDLEAHLLLDQAVAKRDGLPPPAHKPPPFNHSLDQAKLRALKQGQRYRIVTNKGAIIIATDVNECPGSSLAFDSLVTSGYYNGKAFHRVVPNFVAQGGCPRGDGYGSMPWTLRTEIGRTPFTAGSVGLASAGRDTESCQFFITLSAAPHLDGRYTRFGVVVSGMDVVWKLRVGDVMQRVERAD